MDRRPAASALSVNESLYLDVLRALAAIVVLVDHASAVFDLPGWPAGSGHHAVIVFFVLSGFVISHVAATRERSAREFIMARLARLWSVLVPAMVLTVVCDVIGRSFGSYPSAYAHSPIDHPLIRIGATLAFLAQSWVSIQPFSNFAAWSLPIEFWYYMLFAAGVFLPRGRRRTVALAAAAVFCGFKGLLLLPVWLTGVALHRSRNRQRGGLPGAAILFAAGGAIFIWLAVLGPYGQIQVVNVRVLGPWLAHELDQARLFWLDWILGAAIALHLAGAGAVVDRLPLASIARLIRWCAGISFATYLFHEPLLHLCAAFLPREYGMTAMGITAVTIAVIGPVVERTKRPWRDCLDIAVCRLADRRVAFFGAPIRRPFTTKI